MFEVRIDDNLSKLTAVHNVHNAVTIGDIVTSHVKNYLDPDDPGDYLTITVRVV